MNLKHLKIAIEAALKAGQRILEIYHSEDFNIQLKSDDSPLTKADIASHRIIESSLKATNIPLLSEEGKDVLYVNRQQWRQLWIVDPIDGTKEFIKRNGEFTVNIALVDHQKPILGVVFAPVIQELYFSLQGFGAFKITIDLKKPLHIDGIVRNAKKLPIQRTDNTYTIVASRSHLSEETENFIEQMREKHGEVDIISKGSSLKLCMVAEGKADCYPRFAPTMEWDTAAGHAICNEAGFKVLNWPSKYEIRYNRKELKNDWFLVT